MAIKSTPSIRILPLYPGSSSTLKLSVLKILSEKNTVVQHQSKEMPQVQRPAYEGMIREFVLLSDLLFIDGQDPNSIQIHRSGTKSRTLKQSASIIFFKDSGHHFSALRFHKLPQNAHMWLYYRVIPRTPPPGRLPGWQPRGRPRGRTTAPAFCPRIRPLPPDTAPTELAVPALQQYALEWGTPEDRLESALSFSRPVDQFQKN